MIPYYEHPYNVRGGVADGIGSAVGSLGQAFVAFMQRQQRQREVEEERAYRAQMTREDRQYQAARLREERQYREQEAARERGAKIKQVEQEGINAGRLYARQDREKAEDRRIAQQRHEEELAARGMFDPMVPPSRAYMDPSFNRMVQRGADIYAGKQREAQADLAYKQSLAKKAEAEATAAGKKPPGAGELDRDINKIGSLAASTIQQLQNTSMDRFGVSAEDRQLAKQRLAVLLPAQQAYYEAQLSGDQAAVDNAARTLVQALSGGSTVQPTVPPTGGGFMPVGNGGGLDSLRGNTGYESR